MLHLEGLNRPGNGWVVVYLDKSKEIDRVDHCYLVSGFGRFDLGLGFLNCIKHIYENIDPINGFLVYQYWIHD